MYFLVAVSLFLLAFTKPTRSEVLTYNWELTWVTANPDGRLDRPVIGINGQFPLPTIYATIGDQIIVNVLNSLGNESATIHWHGLHQEGSNSMDGPSGVTQCPIPPGSCFTYDFMLNQTGTYWYHSHFGGQMPDGLRGALIIADPACPFQYDEELVLTFSDWYHDQMPGRISYYLSPEQNTDGAEPEPYSAIFNDVQEATLLVEPGKTYYLRIISMAAFAQAYIWIDQHEMTIVEVDGVYVEPEVVDYIYIATAQRYSVLITTKCGVEENFAITAAMDDGDFDSVPEYVVQNVTAGLIYNQDAPFPEPVPPVDNFPDFDDFFLVPFDHLPLYGPPDVSVSLNLSFFTQDDQNRAGFNNITFLGQKVPTLLTALTTGEAAFNASIYGINTNAIVADYGQIVEIVVNNYDTGAHVLHAHGHQFQIVAREPGGDNDTQAVYDGDDSGFPVYPVRRDTWVIAPSGYTIIRFVADNPGIWLFHCHMEWHVAAGLSLVIIEAPLQLQSQTVPQATIDTCKSLGYGIEGNAAGNIQDPYDLDGQITVCPPNPMGALFAGVGSVDG